MQQQAGRRRLTGGFEHPPDACPYERPFAAGFSACPAFSRANIVPLTSYYEPLTPVVTCAHLTAGERHTACRRYYARCALGAAGARMEWVSTVRAERLAAVRLLQDELSAQAQPLMERLWALKGRQLQAYEPAERDRRTLELRAAADDAARDLAALMAPRAELLAEIGLPLEAMVRLIEAYLDDLVGRPTADPDWTPPEEIVSEFPEEARILLQPASRRS